ncbi:Murein L,D-transpeptidase YafK [Nitratireductor aquibiodomus]|uniref:Murein L,D-transpeptidase YafK n=1 Tax=Nitratireductor aquibiodomus TaxID=204799 RepID=A0A1H4K4P3_9HYPH|nr:murein L,D-transpeptidase family protein [Nitratireductor aquibiodomus]SEB53357.1 Murein L,D-transpeptidase YafK [Nitratireductor aquibiodomus]
MTRLIKYAFLLSTALALAACNETLEDIAPKAERQLPARVVQTMKAKGMSKTSPVMMRIFKEEGKLEVWKAKTNGRYDIIASYDICKWSGQLGPKFTEGDRQAPEGFYTVRPGQMNPKSSYYLAFNIGFPNAYDQANGRTGKHLMVHGACSSAGCYSMTDEQISEIYAFARDSFKGGQREFQVQAFPFRMTAENMARYRSDPNYDFWKMLKEGYDHFELTKIPPKVDVCGKRYVFNREAVDGERLSPTAACPPMSQPESLLTAYRQYQAQYDIAFNKALKAQSTATRSETIAGHEEARLVADWSKRRARGEKVSRLPPNIPSPTAVAEAPQPASTPAVAATASAYTAEPASRLQNALEAVAGQPEQQQPAESTAAAVAPVPAEGVVPSPTARPDTSAERTASVPAPATGGQAPSLRRRIQNIFSR